MRSEADESRTNPAPPRPPARDTRPKVPKGQGVCLIPSGWLQPNHRNDAARATTSIDSIGVAAISGHRPADIGLRGDTNLAGARWLGMPMCTSCGVRLFARDGWSWRARSVRLRDGEFSLNPAVVQRGSLPGSVSYLTCVDRGWGPPIDQIRMECGIQPRTCAAHDIIQRGDPGQGTEHASRGCRCGVPWGIRRYMSRGHPSLTPPPVNTSCKPVPPSNPGPSPEAVVCIRFLSADCVRCYCSATGGILEVN